MRRKLLVASREMFHERFNIDVQTDTEVIGIDRSMRTVTVRDRPTGNTRTERYDVLVLSPGAAPIRPRCRAWTCPVSSRYARSPTRAAFVPGSPIITPRRAVVVGGGFIGLEMVENLIHRELSVTILEKLPQVMPPLDPEMAVPLMEHLAAKGVRLHLGDGLARIEERAGAGLVVVAESGARLPADFVILAIGVRPETMLAKDAGLDIGPRGGIVVDAQMRTSRSEHLGRGRCRGSAGRAYGSRNGAAARGTGQPPGTSRG